MDIQPGYIERIRQYYPEPKALSLELNRDGLDHEVVIVNGERVFRFAKDEHARQSLAHEARVLELLHWHIDTTVPTFEELEAGFVTYPLIPGRALHRNELLRQPAAVQEHMAEQVASFLRQLHRVPADELAQAAIPPSGAARSHQDWVRLYEAAESELFPLLISHSRDWVEDLFAPLLDGRLNMDAPPALIHGDLGPYHLLVDPETWTLNGVIDFGTAGLGDPACDFAAIIDALGESFLQRMVLYDPDIEAALDRARFWAGTLVIQWAVQGLRTKDLTWLLAHIGRAADVMPIGWKA